MKKRSNLILIALLATVVLSSCNRGYGCPSNFSIGDTILAAIKTFILSIISLF